MFNRREFLAATAVSATASAFAADDAGWIDAHSHIWPPETDRFPLVAGLTKADLKPPSFTDEELMTLATPEGVSRVVLIQHSVYHLFDNAYLVDAVKRHPKRFRVVGMVDDHQAGAGVAMKKLLPLGVTGFRITPFIRKNAMRAKWLNTPGMAEMWQTAAETRQAMCCLIDPTDLPAVNAMCAKHPETPVVIDHFARIGADGEIRKADVDALAALAKYKQVTVKVSAFYALGAKQAPYRDLIPLMKRMLDAFGPERLMWASDAPYQVQGEHSYAASIRLIRDADFLSKSDREALLRTTAERVYFFA